MKVQLENGKKVSLRIGSIIRRCKKSSFKNWKKSPIRNGRKMH